MRLSTTLTLAAGAAAIGILSSGILGAEPIRKDKDSEAMQGTWTIESLTLDGNKLPPEQLKNWRRIVERSHATWKNGTETMIELDIKFDPSQKPMTLDSKIATGEDKGKTLLAIYELKDDKLRVCFANLGKPRPTEFSSNPGSGQSLYTAKRVKS